MTLVAERKSAWFSSSVPKSEVDIWVENGGFLEPDAYQADFLFSENSEAADIQRIFKDKKFLEGHLTVFSSDVISQVAKQETVNRFDVMNWILLPQKEFDDLGISSLCLRGEDKSCHKNCRDQQHLSDRRFKDSCKRDRPRSKNSTTKSEALRRAFRTPTEKKHAQESSCSEDDHISEFTNSTPGTASLANDNDDGITDINHNDGGYDNTDINHNDGGTNDNININHNDGGFDNNDINNNDGGYDNTLINHNGGANDDNYVSHNRGANRHCGIFYHSLNCDITNLDDIDVPRVKLMDFKPGVGGCRVVKRKTKLCEKNIS